MTNKILREKGKKENLPRQISFAYDGHAYRFKWFPEIVFLYYAPVVGDVFIFQSYILHSGNPFIGREEGMSVAFNASYLTTKRHNKNNHLITLKKVLQR